MDEKNLISFINYQDQYNNIRIFDGDKDITDEYYPITYDLNPERIIYIEGKINSEEEYIDRLNFKKVNEIKSYSVAELEIFAKNLNIKNYSKMRRRDLVYAIKNKLAETD